MSYSLGSEHTSFMHSCNDDFCQLLSGAAIKGVPPGCVDIISLNCCRINDRSF